MNKMIKKGRSKGCIPWNKGIKWPEMSGKNHPFYGKHHTKKSKELISKKKKGIPNLKNRDENNGNWVGDKIGYNGIHGWIRRKLSQPPNCEKCGQPHKQLDLANISQKYLRQLDDWEYICRKCHMEKDERLNNFRIKKWKKIRNV